MAVTYAVLSVSPNRIKFLATQDGAAGTTVTIANADIVHASSGLGSVQDGELLALCSATYANQAAARAATDEGPKCSLRAQARTGAAPTWGADINVAANLLVIDVVAQAGAGTAVIELSFNHSLVR